MYNGRKGSMAPFSLRLLLAELPLYLGQPKVALDRLTDVYLICSKVNGLEIKCFYTHIAYIFFYVY